MAEKCTAKVVYCKDSKGGWYLDDSRHTPVTVVPGKEVPLKSQELCVGTMIHPHLLHCLFIDTTLTRGVYPKHGPTLVDYITTMEKDKKIKLVNTYKVPAIKLDFGSRELMYYVPDVYRTFFKSMIDFVIDLHKENKSIVHLNINRNFIVMNEKLIFGNMSLGGSSTPESEQKDFKLLGEAIRTLFKMKSSTLPMPKDMEHLLNLMDNYSSSSSYGRSTLLANHLAVLPTAKRVTMVRDFAEKYHYLQAQGKGYYENALALINVNPNWSKKLSDLKYGPIKDCYDKGKDKSSAPPLPLPLPPSPSPSVDNQGFTVVTHRKNRTAADRDPIAAYVENLKFIWFCRHLAVHLKENMRKHLKKQPSSSVPTFHVQPSSSGRRHSSSGPNFFPVQQSSGSRHSSDADADADAPGEDPVPSEADTDLTIMAFYWRELLDFQTELANKKILHLFV